MSVIYKISWRSHPVLEDATKYIKWNKSLVSFQLSVIIYGKAKRREKLQSGLYRIENSAKTIRLREAFGL